MQRDDVDLAQVDVVDETGRRIALPGHPDGPLAALVGFVEFYVDAVRILQDAADLVVGPVVVARRIDADEIDSVTGCIDEGDVAVVCRISSACQSGRRQNRKKQAAHCNSSVAGLSRKTGSASSIGLCTLVK